MNRPSNTQHFRVMAPARAYAMLLAISGVILALGLGLPLALASSASSQGSSNHSGGGAVHDSGSNLKAGDTTIAGLAADVNKIPTTAQGVTATSIKVGVVLLDLSSVASLGLGLPNFSTGLQEAQFNSLFNAVNTNGGINGRTIDPVYVKRDTLASSGPESDHAICENLAVDQKVFALVGYTYFAGDCATSQYHLPVVTVNGELNQAYENSDGLLITVGPGLQRDGTDWATAVVKSGLATGRKLGLVAVADASTYQLPGDAIAAQLKALGHPLVVNGEVDPAGAISSLPPLIEKMKAAGVNSVMLGSDFATALRFVALAQAQDYDPQYLTSDEGSLAADGLLAQVSSSFNGAVGFTDADAPPAGQLETPQEKACRENYNAISGVTPVTAGAQSALPGVCDVADIFIKGLTGAGANLNPRSFVQAVQKIGTMPELPGVLPGRFAPGKVDYSDGLRPEKWSSAKKAYSADGAPLSFN